MSIPRDLKVADPVPAAARRPTRSTPRTRSAGRTSRCSTVAQPARHPDQPHRRRSNFDGFQRAVNRLELRLRRRRPPLLPLQRRAAAVAAVRGDRHRARLPEALRQPVARLRALPPRRLRPRPRRAPAGLPAPGQGPVRAVVGSSATARSCSGSSARYTRTDMRSRGADPQVRSSSPSSRRRTRSARCSSRATDVAGGIVPGHQPRRRWRRRVDEFLNAQGVRRRRARPATRARPPRRRARRSAARRRRACRPGSSATARPPRTAAVPAAAKLRLPVLLPGGPPRGRRLRVRRARLPSRRAYTHPGPRGQEATTPTGWSCSPGVAGAVLRHPGHDAGRRRRSSTSPQRHDADARAQATSSSTTARRLRLVAWRTPRGVYWVSNTLSQTLTNRQMLGDRPVADAGVGT